MLRLKARVSGARVPPLLARAAHTRSPALSCAEQLAPGHARALSLSFSSHPQWATERGKTTPCCCSVSCAPTSFLPASYNPFVFVLFEVYWSNQVCPSSCAPRRRVCSAHAAAHWASSGSTGPPCVNFRRGDDSCAKSGGEKVPLRTSRRPSTSDFSENAQGPAASVCAKGARDTRSRTPAWRAPAWRALARNRSCRN